MTATQDNLFLKNLKLVSLIIFLFFLYGCYSYDKVIQTYRFEEVMATVIKTDITQYIGSKGRTHYIPKIEYQYRYGQKVYVSDVYRPLFQTMHQNEALALVNKIQVGSKIIAYVNPERPQTAYLVKGFVPEYILSPAVFICSFFAWLMLIYMYTSGNYMVLKHKENKTNMSFIFAYPSSIGFGLLVLTIGSFIIGLILSWTDAIYTWDMLRNVVFAYVGLFLAGFLYRSINNKPFIKYEEMIKKNLDPNEKTPVETKGKDIAYYTLVGFLLLSFLAFIYSAKY